MPSITRKLTQNQIDTLLISSVSGRVGCCATGKPYVVPIANLAGLLERRKTGG